MTSWLTGKKKEAPPLFSEADMLPERLEQLRAALATDVDATLRAGGEEGCTDACLRRWLVARKGCVADAARDLTAHAAWRIKYVPNGRISEEEVRPQLEQRKLFLAGTDTSGRAVLLLRASRHLPLGDAKQIKRFIIYGFDASIKACDAARNPEGRVVGIIDLEGLAYKNLDLSGLKAVFTTAQAHYPERLSVFYLHQAPSLFSGLWKAVQPFIDPVTKQKIQFTYVKDGTAAALAAMCAPEALPRDMGGGCDEAEDIAALTARLRAAGL